jgi:CheY-like chemotaxis protein
MTESTYNICIVDDDPFLLDMYNLKFQQAGHTVQCFTDGAAALEALRKGSAHDIILLDLIMPQIDGYEVLRTIRQENLVGNTTALVILSNQGQEKDIERAKEYGVDGYLVKANTLPSEVLEKVTDIIERKRENTEGGESVTAEV